MVLHCSSRFDFRDHMSTAGAFSWNSELPSGRNPFWIRDEGLADLGLHVGDAVSVDTRSEPREGDLVVVEVEVDGDSLRIARRYFASAETVRLEPVGTGVEVVEVPSDSLIVMGVIVARLRFSATGDEVHEEPIANSTR
jgi:SOS-response transcriptional repressor LexA